MPVVANSPSSSSPPRRARSPCAPARRASAGAQLGVRLGEDSVGRLEGSAGVAPGLRALRGGGGGRAAVSLRLGEARAEAGLARGAPRTAGAPAETTARTPRQPTSAALAQRMVREVVPAVTGSARGGGGRREGRRSGVSRIGRLLATAWEKIESGVGIGRARTVAVEKRVCSVRENTIVTSVTAFGRGRRGARQPGWRGEAARSSRASRIKVQHPSGRAKGPTTSSNARRACVRDPNARARCTGGRDAHPRKYSEKQTRRGTCARSASGVAGVDGRFRSRRSLRRRSCTCTE